MLSLPVKYCTPHANSGQRKCRQAPHSALSHLLAVNITPRDRPLQYRRHSLCHHSRVYLALATIWWLPLRRVGVLFKVIFSLKFLIVVHHPLLGRIGSLVLARIPSSRSHSFCSSLSCFFCSRCSRSRLFFILIQDLLHFFRHGFGFHRCMHHFVADDTTIESDASIRCLFFLLVKHFLNGLCFSIQEIIHFLLNLFHNLFGHMGVHRQTRNDGSIISIIIVFIRSGSGRLNGSHNFQSWSIRVTGIREDFHTIRCLLDGRFYRG
mmetsp:Transcript_99079/g.285873  ORF Transcript_99079/g.285873 Transcript_99079/m.285873 type:complete len:265 (-) Transcript_99079:1163-1957(-)